MAAIRSQIGPQVPQSLHHYQPSDLFSFVCPPRRIYQRRSALTLSAVDYFANALAPVQSTVDRIFMVNSVYTPSLLQLMLCAEDFGHAGIAAVNATFHQRRSSGKGLPASIIKNICKALSSHRKHLEGLNGQSDDLAILTNLLLTSIAEGMDDLPYIIIFRDNLQSLVAAAGGFDGPRLSPLVRDTILQWESCSALVLGSTTVFPDKYPVHVPCYPSYPYTSEIERMVVSLPRGFQQLASQARFSYDVLRVLTRLVQNATSQENQDAALCQLQPFNVDLGRFTSYWEACPCLSDVNDAYGRPDFEKVVVLGVIIYSFHAFSSHRMTSMLYRAARKRLTADIALRMPCQEEERKVLLWVWLNAVDAWQPPDSPLSPQGLNLLREARDAFPEVASKAQLQELLRTFFWNDAFAQRCSRYWYYQRAD